MNKFLKNNDRNVIFNKKYNFKTLNILPISFKQLHIIYTFICKAYNFVFNSFAT